jgi:hypothetical protein
MVKNNLQFNLYSFFTQQISHIINHKHKDKDKHNYHVHKHNKASLMSIYKHNTKYI